MTVYAYVEENQIKEIYYVMPQSWKNISNFHLLSEDELINHNWYIVKDSPAIYDSDLEEIYDVDYQFVNNEVLRIYLIRNKVINVPEDETSSLQ